MPEKNKARAAWNEMENGYTDKNFQDLTPLSESQGKLEKWKL